VANLRKQRTLVLESCKKKLSNEQFVAIDDSTADEKRLRSRAACKTSGLEVEEHQLLSITVVRRCCTVRALKDSERVGP
jgi:hypothetical protein